MLTIEKRKIQTINFPFVHSSNKERNSLFTKNEVTFPISDFVKLEFTFDHNKPKYLVDFIETNRIDTATAETLEIDWLTYDMLTRVFAANNKNDYHVHVQPVIEFELADTNHKKATILEGNIESVTHETFSKTDEVFKVITSTKSYSVSKEDFYFFKKMVTTRRNRDNSKQ